MNAVYRGWMMKPDLYAKFYQQLTEHNIYLVTDPKAYENMHVFPNVYQLVKADTPKLKVFPLHEEIDIEGVKKEFTRFMVKDYVKSVKGTEFPKYFDHSVDQCTFNQWMEIFYQYRGDLLTGGICIKEYVDLRKYGDKTNEFRVFYMNHEAAAISRNSGQMQGTAEPPKDLVEKF